MYTTYNDPKILRDEIFGFLAVNSENLTDKFSKFLSFKRLKIILNHSIPKHGEDWKGETSEKKKLLQLNKMYIVCCMSSDSWERNKYYKNL